MTREEIEELKGLAASMGLYDDKYPCKRAVILGKAIKALQQESCDDAISRQAVLDRIRESIETYHNQYTTDMLNMWGLFTQFIKEMPPVNPQSKTGHWIVTEDGFECSECGCISRSQADSCEYCRCRMIEPQESEVEE